MANKPGGWSDTMDATEKIQNICDQVKVRVEEKTHENYREFKAVKYIYQIVKGENYVIKVHVGGEDYDHLNLFQALPCDRGEIVLHDVLQHKTKDDPLIPFN
ncbi:cystatin-A-like [Anarrhichthys ocellatus]|uniref:cystatin-A-like n=1 Tax=Anarrhichthys ocellatus TaxID=433405 RepID=UPI0012EEA192|nr:cystatin-A-like [Anarrhichthys ocellatus]